MNLNRSLIRILGFSWLGFLVVGIAIARLFSTEKVTVLVDRSGCDRQSWRQVSDHYSELYKAHEKKRIVLVQVVIVNELGEEVRDTPPTPQEFPRIETFGEPDKERLSRIESGFTNVEVLACKL